MKFYPYKKGGGGDGKSLALLKGGGGTTGFEVVLISELEFLAIVMRRGSAKSFHPLKGGGQKFYLVLRGGGGKSFGPAIL